MNDSEIDLLIDEKITTNGENGIKGVDLNEVLHEINNKKYLNSCTVFVDLAFGDDTTGEFENPDKPFLNIQTAISNLEANTGAASTSTVILRAGTYSQGTVFLSATHKINIYCEVGSVLSATMFSDGFGAIDCSVTGFGLFIPTNYVFQLNYEGSNLIFKALKIISTTGGNLFYSEARFPTYITQGKVTAFVEVDEVIYTRPSTAVNTTGIQARAGSYLNVYIKTMTVKSNGFIITSRSSFNYENPNRIVVKIDTLYLEPHTDNVAWAMTILNINNNSFDNSTILKVKNTYIDSKNCTPTGFLCPILIQGCVGHLKWIGDIYLKGDVSQNLIINAFSSLSVGGTIFDFIGDIKSDVSFIDYPIKNADPNAKMNIKSNINVTTTATASILSSGAGAEVNFINSNVETNSVLASINVVNGGSSKCFNSNFKENTGSEFITDNNTGGNVYLGNVIHDKPINVNVDLISDISLHTEDVNIILPPVNA